MSDLPEGYHDIPEADRVKAQKFFDYGKNAAETGNFDYSITLYLQGIEIDPENTEAHQALREISLKRKASGGKDLGFMEKMKARSARPKEEKQAMLNAERLLAFDPGNVANMVALMEPAHRAGYYDTTMWIAAITMQANISSGKPDFNTFIKLKDTYKALGQWKEAVDACNLAVKMKPDDMDLQRELKDLGAQLTMAKGKYTGGGSFRHSMKDFDKQQALMEKDKDIRSADAMVHQLEEAEAEWKAEPNEPGKISKYVEVLRRTENPDYENRAIEICEDVYKRTGQFRFRKLAGEVKLVQLARMERTMRLQLRENPNDEELKKQVLAMQKDRAEEELKEYRLWAENYPTESVFRFDMGKRMLILGQYDEAIPVFQNVRADPKFRTEAGILLARAFMMAGYIDEAADTLRDLIGTYQLKGDAKSIEMYYYYGRALEQQNNNPEAIKAYSQVAQWNFNYGDVQQRIKKLRGQTGPKTPTPGA